MCYTINSKILSAQILFCKTTKPNKHRKEKKLMEFNINDLGALTADESSLNINFFSLKNDGDSARVRFLYETMNDVKGYCVHRVSVGGNKFRWVNCLRQQYGDPMDACPMCCSPNNDDKKLHKKVWIPVYVEDTGKICLWDRGINFLQKTLYPLMVEKGQPFCGNTFLVERHGEANSMDTWYEIIADGVDDTRLDDFDSIPTPTELILNKSYEELEQYVMTRSFGSSQATQQQALPSSRESKPDNSTQIHRRGTRPNMV